MSRPGQLDRPALIALGLDPLDLPDGIYLNLDPDIYFAQRNYRLGSSDLMRLDRKKAGWWWMSQFNPDQLEVFYDEETGEECWRMIEKKTAARTYGSALHALMLEGVWAYETRFMVEPDKRDFPGLLTSVDAIKKALAALPGYERPPRTSKWLQEDWHLEAAAYLPTRPIWSEIKADFDKLLGDREAVSAIEDRMLRLMHHAAVDPTNPDNIEVRELLGAGEEFPVLAEVSIFYTDTLGVRRRARLDRMAPKFTCDLKSLANLKGENLPLIINDYIRREGYDIQLADQHVARRWSYDRLREGTDLLFGGTDEQRLWIQAIAERNMQFDYTWLFYQKPDATRGLPPVLFPLYDLWKSDHHVTGLRKALRARDFYLEMVDRFGLDNPWVVVLPAHYTSDQFQPHVHPGWQAMTPPAYPGEEEFLR